MKKYKILSIIVVLLFGLGLSSCTNWLDVKSKTMIDEEELFSRELGFKEALTGIYIQLTQTQLYGENLTYGFVDVLAQRYEPAGGTDRPEKKYAHSEWYKFPSVKNETYIDAIWKKGYNTIANINNFIGWVDKNGEVLKTPKYKELMKGEAIAIRSLIYFDLLRLYGPIYKNDPSSPSIPYRTVFNREDKKLVPANEMVENIIKDLLQAEELLSVDGLSMEFPRSASDASTAEQDPFLQFRYKRMNLMAVKALLARIYLYKGDLTNAQKRASEVIDAADAEGNSYFELVTDNSTDRIYSRELIFSVSVDKFDDVVDKEFLMLPDSRFFCLDKKKIQDIFNVDNDGFNDMRVREGQGFEFTATAGITRKYDQRSPFSSAILNTIPIIRLSEMYYILAECEPDLSKSAVILSQVRAARGGDDFQPFTNAADKEENIMIEYRKEFYAEGQLWYYYKRFGYKTFLYCPVERDLTDENYRLSIPENETIFGNVN